MRSRVMLFLVLSSLAGWPALVAADRSSAQDGARSGQEIYTSLCENCHGRYGRGNGPLAGNLERRPADLTTGSWPGDRTDDQIVAALRGADHAPMAIASVLDEASLRGAIAYMRSLTVPGGGISVRAGEDIYQAACWACHGREGKGDGRAALGRDPKPRDFTSDAFQVAGRETEVARIVSEGAEKAFHGSADMPAWAQRLSAQQIRDVVEYLKVLAKPGS